MLVKRTVGTLVPQVVLKLSHTWCHSCLTVVEGYRTVIKGFWRVWFFGTHAAVLKARHMNLEMKNKL